MRKIPLADPGEPDTRSATRFLLWLGRQQASTLIAGLLFGCLWMLSLAVTPFVIGRAIDQIIAKDSAGVLAWTGTLLGLAVLTGIGSTMRHRCDTSLRLGGSYQVIQLVTRQVTRLGAALDRQVATGEVVAVGTTDITQIGYVLDVAARGLASVVAILVVAGILLATSLPVGLLVLIGAPALLFLTGPLLKPLNKRAAQRRDLQADLTGRAADIVAGLRVLRGIGGEARFGARYRRDSQDVRDTGIHVARIESMLQAAGVLLPGLLAAAVVWIGASLAVSGRLTAGELVTYYSYAAFLGLPIHTVTELVDTMVGGSVAARRVVDILRLPPVTTHPTATAVPVGTALHDPVSGLTVAAGRFVAVATAVPEEGIALADRLGYFADSAATLGGVELSTLPLPYLREQVLVADNDARLFSGALADTLDGAPDEVAAALRTACAEDIVEALPDGLDTQVGERGLTFSGGEQQRIRLARALLAAPPVLVLVDPTSAVDAHTESVIASRLHTARAGRTTVVVTTSPLVLNRADEVAFLVDGAVVDVGGHRTLTATSPRYAAAIIRDES